MKKAVKVLTGRKGDVIVFTYIIVFVIITLSVIIIEYFRIESMYQQVEFELQRDVNSSIESSMMDDYRSEGISKMDTALADNTLREYIKKNRNRSYALEVQCITATDIPPQITLKGLLVTRSVFNFLTGEIKLPFTISSRNNRIDKEDP